MIPFNPTQGMKEGWLEECLKNIEEFKNAYKNDPEAKRLIDAAMKLEGVARHASIHACGVVITKDPLINSIPLQYAARANAADSKTIVTQYEMHAIEDLGLLKMDLLGLKNLSIIETTVGLISQKTGERVNFDEMNPDDPRVFEMLARGNTLGVFQLEGDGMTRYLKELGPTGIEDIIAMISLYRPGPMELIPSYIKRKYGAEAVSYLHPKLEPILKNKYGIGVYQEQMMRIARDLAGFTLSEADTLRKAIGKKIKKLLNEQEEKLVSGMLKNGISPKTAKAVWELFPPFARYGFNRSHAAAYGLVAYQTAWLKRHHPLEFMSALMNADEKDAERIAVLVGEAKKMNIEVLPPDINLSGEGFTPLNTSSLTGQTPKPTIRFGLRTIKNVGANVVSAIIEERKINGPYSNLANLLERARSKDLNKKSLESLVKSGALDAIGERNQMLENLETILGYHRETVKIRENNQSSLFGLMNDQSTLPRLKLKESSEATMEDKLRWEKELLGLYISGHPLERFKARLEKEKMKIETARTLTEGAPAIVGAFVESIQKINTKNGDPMVFLRLLDYTGAIEAVIFPKTLQQYSHLIQEEAGLKIKGRISHRNGKTAIIANEIKALA